MKTIKTITATMLCLAMIFATACSAQPEQPNEMPTPHEITDPPATKFMGSNSVNVLRVTHESIEDLVRSAQQQQQIDGMTNKIIIGKVEGLIGTREVFRREPNESDPSDYVPPSDMASDYKIVVYDTLFGERVETLTLSLLGTPDSHLGTTKPEIGDGLLLFLWRHESHAGDAFSLTEFEESMFRINPDGTLYSFSNELYTAQFDGKPLEALTSEIGRVLAVMG